MFILIAFVVLAFFLVLLLVGVKLVISDYAVGSFSREEASSYECGFEQYSLSRVPFSIRYFILTLVFLVFDLEITLLIFSPSDLLFTINKFYMAIVSLSFIFILFLGLLYEWFDGSLD